MKTGKHIQSNSRKNLKEQQIVRVGAKAGSEDGFGHTGTSISDHVPFQHGGNAAIERIAHIWLLLIGRTHYCMQLL